MARTSRRFSKNHSRKKTVKFPEIAQIEVTALGAQGDGLAQFPSGEPAYIPYTLPGDILEVKPIKKRGDGFVCRILNVVTPSAERQAPACSHFASCGGCRLQHLSNDAYIDFKQNHFQQVFAAYPDKIAPLQGTTPHHRRRATFSMRFLKDGQFFLGFNQDLSKDVLNLTQCPLLHDRLWTAYQEFFPFAKTLFPKDMVADIKMTLTDTGVDIVIYHAQWEPDFNDRQDIAEFCQKATLSGLYLCQEEGGFPEPLFQKEAPMLRRPGGYMPISPGSFLQADQIGEKIMTDKLCQIMDKITEKGSKSLKMLDLFCGSGTFTFPLSQYGHVHAVEADRTALQKLEASAKQQTLTISTEARNLFSDPLLPKELSDYDLVLFDPPRAGAKAQAEKLAETKVPYILAISCNPMSLSRDLETLIDSGYKLEEITPIDQFLWSHHLEAFAFLSKEPTAS